MIDGGDGDDFLQGGPKRNRIVPAPATTPCACAATARTASARATATTPSRPTPTARATIDCGPGTDRVNIGFNRKVRTRGCEKVKHLYTTRRLDGGDRLGRSRLRGRRRLRARPVAHEQPPAGDAAGHDRRHQRQVVASLRHDQRV